MTTYSNSIPQPGDDPSQSQDQILQNFQSLNTSNSVNHVAYNDADQGKHKFLQMPEQGAAPGTAANEGGLYTKATAAAITGLFFQRESSGIELQLTDIDAAMTTVYSGSQYTFVSPWGMRFTYGTTGTYTNQTLVSYSTPFSAAPYFIQMTITDTNQVNGNIRSPAAYGGNARNGFQVSLSTATVDQINYFAIGPV